MLTTIILSFVLTPTMSSALVPASTLVPSADVVAVRAPQGIRVVTVPVRERLLTADELVRRYTYVAPAFTFRQSFNEVGDIISESDLFSRYRTESDLVMSKFVRLAVELMRLKGLSLNVTQGTPVHYDVETLHKAGRTTVGLIDACWECFGSAGNREYAAHALGLNVGSLEHRVSDNPRFTPRQLIRGSASVLNLVFETNERGSVRVPLIIELDEAYQPFVADVPTTKELFGKRVYGVSQRLRFTANAALDESIFGVTEVDFTELDLFNLVRQDAIEYLPTTFESIRDRAVEEAPTPGFARRALKDLTYYFRAFYVLTRDRLMLPGRPGFLDAA